jgi:hypothetical protein
MSQIKVMVTNGQSVVVARVWHHRSPPFTPRGVYGVPDGLVYGFQAVSLDQKESNLYFSSSSEGV